jgi:hypothetical protein
MQSSGNSEFDASEQKKYSLTFWQNFALTLAGACGLISLVVDGPRWITYPSLTLVIVLLVALILKNSNQ